MVARKESVETLSLERAQRRFDTIQPALEKARSAGTEVAARHKKRRASLATRGYLAWRAFHHSSGSAMRRAGLAGSLPGSASSSAHWDLRWMIRLEFSGDR